VRQNYLMQAKREPDRYRIIDADRSVAEVHTDVLKIVSSLVPSPGTPGEG
jgi:thymidylate kinase